MQSTKPKIVFFTGAGVSQESGIQTFRDSKDGLWNNHKIEDVATASAVTKDLNLVNQFYNERRAQLHTVEPNLAHKLIADLERTHDVTVITQNVDNLHEKAGSTRVIHLHGELNKVRSLLNPKLVYEWTKDVTDADRCESGARLRPHIVFFQEMPMMIEEAVLALNEAETLVIIGTAFSISYTEPLLTTYTNQEAIAVYIDPQPVELNFVANNIRKTATEGMRELFVDIHVSIMREQTFHMDDNQAREIVENYLNENPILLDFNNKEYYLQSV